jgi:hypothetical protein
MEEKRLLEIQEKVDLMNEEVAKKDFLLKKEHLEKMKDLLKERDSIVKKVPEFWMKVFGDSESLEILHNDQIVEDEEEAADAEEVFLQCQWIRAIRIEYREGFRHYLRIEINENPFFENSLLEKEFSLFTFDPEFISTEIRWKGKQLLENPLLRFFSTKENDDNLAIFDILCDIYVNGAYYYAKTDERSAFLSV